MHPKCIQAVEDHLTALHGRPMKLTPAAIKRIDSRMHEAAKVLQRRDPARWQNWNANERTEAMGKWVTEQEQIAAEATMRSKVRQLSAITNQVNRLNQFAAARPDKAGKYGKAVIDVLEGVDNAMRGAELSALRGFGDMVQGSGIANVHSRGNREFFEQAVREIYGQNTGNAKVQAFVKLWKERIEGQRQARNRAGGTVGTIDNYAPQYHSASVMQRQGQQAWGDFMMQRLDRSKYMDENGVQLDDAALRPVVDKMYMSIVTDGGNKLKLDPLTGTAEGSTGGTGGSNVAKAMNEAHREIFLKDADSVLDYNKQFSDIELGTSFFRHMLSNSRDVALMNELGPNPEMTFATLRDTARVKDTAMPGAKFQPDGLVEQGKRGLYTADAYYRTMVGTGNEYTHLDQISTALVGYQAATKLTNTALRSVFQDTPGILLNMADTRQLGKIGAILHTAFLSKADAAKFGIGAEVAARHVSEASLRMASQGRMNVGNMISRYAQATMKYTGLEAWTNAARRAGQTSHAFALGEWSATPWHQLEAGQQDMLRNAGIQEWDWSHINNVPRQKLRGHDIHDVNDVDTLGLDPDTTAALQAKMMGFVRMGGDIVTSEHNLTSSTHMSAGGRANALTKQTMLFKNAGAVQTVHMLDRYSRASGAGKIGLIGATAAMGVGFGYSALVAQALVTGQNPPPINDWRTIGKAMGVSGGFAMIQDVITSMYDGISGDNAGHTTSAIPVFGDAYNIGKIAMTAATGDTSKAGYMAIKFARQQVAPLNYWYTKAAVDHLFFNDAAENLNPGYNKRLRSYADQKGQQYFWDPQGGAGESFGIGEYRGKE